jgi:hypothetical protein
MLLKNLFIYFLFLGVAFNITYWAIAKYDVYSDFRAVNDARYYIQMSQGNYDGVLSRYAKRFILPEMVRSVNRILNIEGFLSRYYEDVDKKTAQLSFGVINILFLASTAFLFFLFTKNLGFSELEGLLGSLLFLTSFFVITYYTLPLVDSAGCFFVMACFYALQRQSIFWLAVSFLIGVFAKESTFIIFLASFFVVRSFRWGAVFACLPGILLYFLITGGKSGEASGYNIFEIMMMPALLKNNILGGFKDFSWFTLIETVQLMSFAWIFFFWGLFRIKKPEFIKRQLWLLFLPLLVPFLVGESSVSRVAFYLFPIFLPIVMLGIKDILE